MRFCFIFLLLSSSVFGIGILDIATKAMQAGDFTRAKTLLEKSIELGEGEIFARYNLGYVYFRLGDMAKSISSYRRVIELNPIFINAYHNLSRVYYKLEDYPKAVEVMKKSIEVDPEYTQSYLLMGDLYNSIETYDLAETSYREALKHDITLVDAYLALMDLYVHFEDFDKALDISEEAIGFVEKNKDKIYKQQAYIYSKLGDPIKSASIYERLIGDLDKTKENADELYRLYEQLFSTYKSANFDFMAMNILKEMVVQFGDKDNNIENLNLELNMRILSLF